jgi:hypothetical protein
MGNKKAKQSVPTLELVAEYRLASVLGMPEDARLEASGICGVGSAYYIVFDNLPDVARLDGFSDLGHLEHRWLRQTREAFGFEDIAYDAEEQRFYVLIEAAEQQKGMFKPVVEEYDQDFNFLDRRTVDFELESGNKGFEAIGFHRNRGIGYLFMVCEGNRCKGGAAGRKPGGGRLQIFRKGQELWQHVLQVKLPKNLPFEDYSGLELSADRVALVSQASSAAWIARLAPETMRLVDDGLVYNFPRNKNGDVIYCNVEGVAWCGPDHLVTVSDRAKASRQPGRCALKDQSIHLFKVPADA